MTYGPPPPGFPGAYGPAGPGYGMPPARTYPEIAATVPDGASGPRYAEMIASYPMVMATPTIPRPASTYDASYHQLPQERFYQFRMWLQSPEGQNYKRWEGEARSILDVIEPFNARWAAGWMAVEAELVRPLVSYLDVFDTYTRQLLTHSDLNPIARNSIFIGHQDPHNPIPYDVLAGRLPERTPYQEQLDTWESKWQDRFGVALGSAWRTSWGPAEHDPHYIAGYLRQIIDAVTDRLWADSELPEIPTLPRFAPQVSGVPDSLAGLVDDIVARCGGDPVPAKPVPEPAVLPPYPTPMPDAGQRWSRGGFQLGRAIAVGGRKDWAEGVALEVMMGQQPMVKVQRYDGSIAWFPVNDILGIR